MRYSRRLAHLSAEGRGGAGRDERRAGMCEKAAIAGREGLGVGEA